MTGKAGDTTDNAFERAINDPYCFAASAMALALVDEHKVFSLVGGGNDEVCQSLIGHCRLQLVSILIFDVQNVVAQIRRDR